MPENGIIERLSTFTGVNVTVNLLAAQVDVILTGNPDLSVNGTLAYFQRGENIAIEGFSLTLPFQFGQGNIASTAAGAPGFFQLGWRDSLGNAGTVGEVGDQGRINVPDPNQWFETFAFVPQPAAVASKYRLQILGVGYKCSMFNAPAALDGVVLDCAIHLKVRHTLALIP